MHQSASLQLDIEIAIVSPFFLVVMLYILQKQRYHQIIAQEASMFSNYLPMLTTLTLHIVGMKTVRRSVLQSRLCS